MTWSRSGVAPSSASFLFFHFSCPLSADFLFHLFFLFFCIAQVDKIELLLNGISSHIFLLRLAHILYHMVNQRFELVSERLLLFSP